MDAGERLIRSFVHLPSEAVVHLPSALRPPTSRPGYLTLFSHIWEMGLERCVSIHLKAACVAISEMNCPKV